MFLKAHCMHPQRLWPNRQHGFLMPLAMFLIVAMASIAIAASRLSSSSFSASVQTGVSVQSLYAADSGAQLAAHKLLFDVSSKGEADTNCATIDGSTLNFNITGLANCTTSISCSLANNGADTINIYDITSAATCGSADLSSERTIALRAIFK